MLAETRKMFTILMPVADYIPRILEKLGLPPVSYNESKDEGGLYICTATVYFSKDRNRLRMFSASSPDGAASARHLSIVAVAHHIKEAFHILIVDMNHRELAVLKEKIHLTEPGSHALVKMGTEPDQPAVVQGDRTEAQAPPKRKRSMPALAIEVSSAKKIKAPRTSVSGKGVATGWKGSEDDCLREMKAMQHRIEQLNTENAKLHTELTEFKLKSNHFKDTKTRLLICLSIITCRLALMSLLVATVRRWLTLVSRGRRVYSRYSRDEVLDGRDPYPSFPSFSC
ncbi:hypothetical protein M5689_003116 [Euphorbia peplus]|nr:hypothetical protein M5689_003116 [Euphorbia peplus]